MAQRNAALPATQALFDGYVKSRKMPGIVAAIGLQGRPPMFVAAGRTGIEPNAPAVTPDSLWRVYSMTKPITAMAAMILIEEGKLTLDQPLSDIYPAYKTMRVLTNPQASLDSRPATNPITIRELMTHTAGLGYSFTAKGRCSRNMNGWGWCLSPPMRRSRPRSARPAPPPSSNSPSAPPPRR